MSVGVVNKQTGDRIPTAGMPAIDNALDLTSVNPVQNAVITAALAGKADTGIVADDFDSTASYVIGNYCIENGKLYRFKANHSGAWSASDVEEVKIAGELSSLKSGLTNLDNEVNGDATTYPYADVITINDAVPANLADCSVKIEPVQDLHGYDKPWVGGAGKNKLPLTVDGIKAVNNGGTWSENAYTFHGVTYTILTDADNNVTGIRANGTSDAGHSFYILNNTSITFTADMILNGSPSDASTSTARLRCNDTYNDVGSGVTIPANTTIVRVDYRVSSGYVCNNIDIYPMIRLSTETDATFAPYTNICPISGHTEAKVDRVGKNLFDKDDAGIIKGYALNSQTGVTYQTALWSTSNFIEIEPSTTYTLNTIQGVGNSVAFYDSEKTYISGESAFGTRTTPSNAKYLRFDYKTENLAVIQLELGSTATAYEPYSGQQYTLALGDTIYGGTVDFETGVMTVDRKYIEFDGGETESWTSPQDRPHSFCHTENLGIADAWSGTDIKMISNQFTQNGEVAYYGSNYRIGYNATNGLFFVGFPSIDNVADFKTYLSNNHLQVVGILATPFTVQLTPQQIQLLQGTNTLTASTGDISVTVNGVSGAIGSVQEQVNGLAGKIGENQIYSDTPVQIGTVGDKPLYRLFVTFETPISSVDNAYTSTGINSEDIELILRGDGINADGTYYGHLAFDPTFNDHQAIGVKGVANIKYAVIEYI